MHYLLQVSIDGIIVQIVHSSDVLTSDCLRASERRLFVLRDQRGVVPIESSIVYSAVFCLQKGLLAHRLVYPAFVQT